MNYFKCKLLMSQFEKFKSKNYNSYCVAKNSDILDIPSKLLFEKLN